MSMYCVYSLLQMRWSSVLNCTFSTCVHVCGKNLRFFVENNFCFSLQSDKQRDTVLIHNSHAQYNGSYMCVCSTYILHSYTQHYNIFFLLYLNIEICVLRTSLNLRAFRQPPIMETIASMKALQALSPQPEDSFFRTCFSSAITTPGMLPRSSTCGDSITWGEEVEMRNGVRGEREIRDELFGLYNVCQSSGKVRHLLLQVYTVMGT